MIIDITDTNGNGIMRYQSDALPRCGDTISTFVNGKKSWTVMSVDHLIANRAISDEMYLQLVSVLVKPIKLFIKEGGE